MKNKTFPKGNRNLYEDGTSFTETDGTQASLLCLMMLKVINIINLRFIL